jgi:ABC-type lipoprotein release transport system permease subunit
MGLKYSTLPIHSQIGVSFDTFKVLGSIPKDENVPIREIKVKISNISDVKNIAQQIRAINKNIHRVWDYSELKDTIDRIDNILTTVTYILLGMVLTISFFSLLTTACLNVVGQTSEIAILLILGYSRSRITRIFVYENLVLVLNSCLIGLAVGYLVAQMMGLQREIFSELPISVEVRGVPLLLAMALLSSCLSTYKPLKEIFRLTVSQILNYSR